MGEKKPIYPHTLFDNIYAEYSSRLPDVKSITLAKAGNNTRSPTEARHYNKRVKKSNCLMMVAICLAIIVFISTIALSIILFFYIRDLSASRQQHTSLREVTKPLIISEFDLKMHQINSDYVCWITIENTMIDYPVVRGQNNEEYLHTSFYGEENIFGTLFMDYRSVGEYVPHIIIYGHNLKQGDMFGGLRYFLDDEYLANHPIITLKVNDRIVEYEIFSARKSNINDYAYHLNFSAPNSFAAFAERCGAPEDATQILSLSTCVSGDDKGERVIVQGVLLDRQ